MCNTVAGVMRKRGSSNKQIFSKDRSAAFSVSADFRVNVSGPEINPASPGTHPTQKLNVVCKKFSGPQVPTAGSLKNRFGVNKAAMKLQEVATKAGACKVVLTTAIVGTEAGATVKYRYVHSNGKRSKTFSTKTAANKIAVVKHQWDIPNGKGPELGWMQMEGVSVGFKSNRSSYSMQCFDPIGGLKPTAKKPTVAVPLGGSGRLSN